MINLNHYVPQQLPNHIIMQLVAEGQLHFEAAAIFNNFVQNPANFNQQMPNQPMNIQLEVIPEGDEDAITWKVSKMVKTIR